jgi:hypothetical protein
MKTTIIIINYSTRVPKTRGREERTRYFIGFI